MIEDIFWIITAVIMSSVSLLLFVWTIIDFTGYMSCAQ